MLQSVGGSFSASGWTGTRCASEYQWPDAYPPNKRTVSIERRGPTIVLKKGAEDPELLVSAR